VPVRAQGPGHAAPSRARTGLNSPFVCSSEDKQATAERLRMALDLSGLAEELLRQRYRRETPEESEEEIETRIGDWRGIRPGAEHGDAAGRPVPWPRPR
jgi:hypothetical protein